MPETTFDFSYPWWLSYGHLLVFGVALAILAAVRLLGWPRWVLAVLVLVALWAGASAVLVYRFGIDTVPPLPTQAFLRAGTGRVLDMGAGTGRSAIMVLRDRPGATLVALDLFSESFEQHFGPGGRPQDRLLANLRAAGVDDRASIETGDMRELPFPAGAFDAIVSAYAVDHLGSTGAAKALAEAHRVLKPQGEFLLILVADDRWTTFLFGPLLKHGGIRGRDWWRQQGETAGFVVEEAGTSPATMFFLLRAK